MEKRRKIDEVNIFKAMAAIFVVVIHITATPITSLRVGSVPLTLFTIINRFAKPSVPMFIFASGLALFYVYKYRELKYIEFFKKRFSVVLIPYVLWTVFYYLYFIYKGYYVFSLRFLIEGLAIGNMVYHLYFIVIIMQFYLLFGIFHYAFKKFNPHLILLLSIVAQVLFMKYVSFKYGDRFFMTYISYFALGGYISIYIEKINDILIKGKVFLTGIFLVIGSYYTYQFYDYFVLKNSISGFIVNMTYLTFSIIAIFFFYYVSILISSKTKLLKKVLNKINKASFYIYFAHPFAIMICEGILNRLGVISITNRFLINFIFILVTVVPLSILYVELKKVVKGNRLNKKEVTA